MALLGYLLAQRQIAAIFALTVGAALLPLLIVFRSRIIQNRPGSKTAWVLLIEIAVYDIVIGVLLLYGVEATIAGGLAAWLFISAMLATIIVYLVNISRRPRLS